MRFDLVDLRLFLHVAEGGSITAGAARAHLSLAAASQRIQELEAALGAALLVRGRRGVQPTPAGEVVVRHARALVRQLAHMEAELAEHAGGLKGQVRVLCNTAALSEYLPQVLAGFMARHAGVDVDLEERPSFDAALAVRAGAADLAIVTDTVDLSGLQAYPFRRDRLVAVAAPAQARRLLGEDVTRPGATVGFSRLADVEQVGLAGDSALFRYLARQAEQSGRLLRARVRVRSFEAVCQVVAGGIGVGIVSEPAARRCAQAMDLAVIELADAWALRRLVVCVRSLDELPRQAQLLVEALRAEWVG
ncbi:LysR family transcriptional regulator [Massilia forsythiae]|uniref:LysR family transcriptional regulator n=1 Tax=Massilia forsythiae TaxID=2728020 RepID=A0A7Z2ZU06_9BURK|nr:LysR substrate-binding domain-containing protein [Massilia forsythiae]QJE00567.1 LysR family transcriptional regulator [Massilia forsythiae]